MADFHKSKEDSCFTSAIPNSERLHPVGTPLFDSEMPEAGSPDIPDVSGGPELLRQIQQRIVSLKEVQLSVTIEENDVAVKAKNAVKFLEAGDKVKVSIRFRGRQIAHSDIGMKVMQDFAERVKDVCTVERRPMIEGRNMLMILAPKAEKASKADKAAKAVKQEAPQA